MEDGHNVWRRSSRAKVSLSNRPSVLPLDDSDSLEVMRAPFKPPKVKRHITNHGGSKAKSAPTSVNNSTEHDEDEEDFSSMEEVEPPKREKKSSTKRSKKPIQKEVVSPTKGHKAAEVIAPVTSNDDSNDSLFGFVGSQKQFKPEPVEEKTKRAALPLPDLEPSQSSRSTWTDDSDYSRELSNPFPSPRAQPSVAESRENNVIVDTRTIVPAVVTHAIPSSSNAITKEIVLNGDRKVIQYGNEPFLSEKQPSSPRPRILFGLTGSVAAIKVNDILVGLTKYADVIVVATKSAEHFISDFGDAKLFPSSSVRFFNDASEYNMWHKRNDPVLHIELRKWADFFLIAPLSANTLAKLAAGICDNLVTSIARAWDFTRPFYVAPAMNTLMWTHPFTQKHLSVLEELGIKVINPTSKTLMCGDSGVGAMADIPTILREADSAIKFYPREH